MQCVEGAIPEFGVLTDLSVSSTSELFLPVGPYHLCFVFSASQDQQCKGNYYLKKKKKVNGSF